VTPTNGNAPRPRSWVVEAYFMEHRAKLIDVAAFLDRVDRAPADADEEDVRLVALREAMAILADVDGERARRILDLFSDPTEEPIAVAPGKGACGVDPAFGKSEIRSTKSETSTKHE
jgi:hypothetical protein